MACDPIPGISREVAEKLTRVRPATLVQASGITDVTPAAMANLDRHLTLAARKHVSRETYSLFSERTTMFHVKQLY
jgi:tRNA U34 5-carboxymethylaminomethyl modifying enzyme MnmG/GidA